MTTEQDNEYHAARLAVLSEQNNYMREIRDALLSIADALKGRA